MKQRFFRLATAAPVTALLVFASGPGPVAPITAHALDYSKLNKMQKRLLSGLADFELNPANAESNNAGNEPKQYFPAGQDNCPTNLSSNIRVNQACTNLTDPNLQGRGQAQNETSIAQDPNNPNHIVASYNNYQRGDGGCIGAYSLDKARTWNDTMVPMSFTRGRATNPADQSFNVSREYWQAGGDTSVAWDSKGNAYMSCQVFNRGNAVSPNQDQSSALLVFRSTKNNGASWNFPGRYVFVENDTAGAGTVLEDKQLMTVDNNPTACATQTVAQPGSSCTPFQDRVYVSWTEFAADGSAYIYEAYSADYGEHFSPRHLVSVDNPLCVNTFGAGTPTGNCNQNQFSQPFVGPDGVLYIIFNNYNNATKDASDNRNQILIARSFDGGNTFDGTRKVADYYDLPACAAYQGPFNPTTGFGADFGRACVPEKGPTSNSIFRATNYGTGAVNPTNPGQIVVTFGSYINPHSNEANGCAPAGFFVDGNDLYTGVKAPGLCNNDILESVSNDGGSTFTGTTVDPRALTSVTQDANQAVSDQFWQWESFTKTGKLAVSYYDRQYGAATSMTGSTVAYPADEFTGFSDVSLSGSGDVTNFAIQRVTSSSMPFPTQFGGVFYGDYSGLTSVDNAYPLWSDTRNPDVFLCPGTGTTTAAPAVCTLTGFGGIVANDQDAYTAALPVPSK